MGAWNTRQTNLVSAYTETLSVRIMYVHTNRRITEIEGWVRAYTEMHVYCVFMYVQYVVHVYCDLRIMVYGSNYAVYNFPIPQQLKSNVLDIVWRTAGNSTEVILHVTKLWRLLLN